MNSTRWRMLCGWLWLVGLGACATPSAVSQPAPSHRADVLAPRDPAAPASFAVAPYLWAAGLAGDVRAGSGPGSSVAADFGDLLENLEGGVMLAGEAWLGREWGLLADVTWMDLAAEGTGPLGNVAVRGETEMLHGQVSAMWRPEAQEQVVLDFLGGVRILDLESGLQTNTLNVSVGETFLDPVLGLRATVPLGAGWQIVTLVDAGGFGIGTDLSYQLLATVGWQMSESVGFGLGWRQLGIDFDEPDLAMDVAFSGPLLGMRISF